jgi:hypothetical protein
LARASISREPSRPHPAQAYGAKNEVTRAAPVELVDEGLGDPAQLDRDAGALGRGLHADPVADAE